MSARIPTGELPSQKRDKPIRVLLVEDNPGDARLIQEMLKSTGNMNLRFEHVTTLDQGLEYVGDPEQPLDAVLLDLGLPDCQGFETFERFQEKGKAFTIIILSGLNDVDLALHAVRSGAQDYLVKGQINGDLLLRSIRYAIERDETEKQLVESRERYQSLVDMMPDAIMVHVDSQIVFANPAALNLLGVSSQEELEGRNVLDLVHPNDRSVVTARIVKQAETEEAQSPVEEKFIRSDGRMIDVEVTATPFLFEDKQATQLIIRDISERKVRESEMEAIAAVSRGLQDADTQDEMLPVIMDQAMQAVGALDGSITLMDEQSGDHHIVAGRGPRASQPVGSVIPRGMGLTSKVVEDRSAYINNQFIIDPDPAVYQVVKDVTPTKSVAIFPIFAEDKVIGTLGLGRDLPFENSDVRVINAICSIGGNAIHRAALYEQTQRRLRHLRSLREIDLAITSSLDINFILDVILTQANRELDLDAAAILLLNAENVLEFAAGNGFRSQLIRDSRVNFGQGLAGRAAQQRQLVRGSGEALYRNTLRPQLFQQESFLSYHAVPLVAKGKVIGVLETFHRSEEVRDTEWEDFLLTLAGQAAIAIDNASLFRDLQRSNDDLRDAYERTIEGWAHALALHDMETIEHSRRVTETTVTLARHLGLDDDRLVHVRRGALLHDIGKMGIPDQILGKTGPLNENEWHIMRKHPEYAGQMLEGIEFLHPAMPIPLYHHEKWDGSGYPHGLKGQEIPLEARIFAIIDVWDALTSDRPYRPAWETNKVKDYLRDQAGKHFDPHVVESFFLHILEK